MGASRTGNLAATPVEAAAVIHAEKGPGGEVGNPGVLNFGDCLSYGVAAAEREPLLFERDDFTRTDIAAVAW